MPAIRKLYEAQGADRYYRDNADDYINPHFPEVKDLLERNFYRLDCRRVLDFCAGGGEVSQVLQGLGGAGLIGCDPYTYRLFERNTGLPCLRFSFRDVIKGADIGNYSLIVSSFALHLCPEKDLFPLVWPLLDAAPMLAVITPHKRPELECLPGIALIWEDYSLTGRGKKVRLKVYARE